MLDTHAPTLQLLHNHRDEILQLAHQHGAYNVRVFGSVARSTATANSDIDLLVCWDYTRLSAWGGVGFDLAVAELVGYPIHVISENSLSPLLKAQILAEAVPL